MAPLRVFISYAERDDDLRAELDTHLTPLSRQGLITLSRNRPSLPGADARREADQHLAEADVILLLVSAAFVASEECYGVELEQAMVRHRAGSARVVPIIIRPVDWQHLPFGDIAALPDGGARPVASYRSRDEAWVDVAAALRRLVSHWRPTARAAVEPPGAGYSAAWYVTRPREERDALNRLATPGLPAVLRGPQLFGKTLFLQHLVAQLRATPPGDPLTRVAAVDLRRFDADAWTSADRFFRALAKRITKSLGIPDIVDDCFTDDLPPARNFACLLEERLLPDLPDGGRLVLAIDHADAVCERTPDGSHLPDDFFGLLRSLCEDARSDADNILGRLRLLCAISSSPAFLLRTTDQSLFYFTDDVHVVDWEDAQIVDIARRHGLPDPEGAPAILRPTVGGHPYLVRIALYRAVLEAKPLADLLRDPTNSQFFDDYLRRIRARLDRARLFDDVRAVHANPRAALSPDIANHLQRAGIITSDYHDGTFRHRLRYPLYERMLRL